MRGLKIVHQNIRSLLNKMNKQCFIISQTNSGIQLLTMSETWNGKDISDAELEIPVY